MGNLSSVKCEAQWVPSVCVREGRVCVSRLAGRQPVSEQA